MLQDIPFLDVKSHCSQENIFGQDFGYLVSSPPILIYE